MQIFKARNNFGELDVYYLNDYHAYKISDAAGNKIKNPDFSASPLSGLIMDLKGINGTTLAQTQKAAGKFATELLRSLNGFNQIPKDVEVTICIIPSSKANKPSVGMQHLVKAIVKIDPRFKDGSSTIIRIADIEKLATGGNRDSSVHLKTMKVTTNLSRSKIYVVLDDVGTTGNSIAVGVELLRREQAQAQNIFPIVLGKTYDRR